MDPMAVNANITVDDFDSVLEYPIQSDWTTPDPSSKAFNGNDPAYLRGTYHSTETKGASVSLNFTGPAIYVYGHTGPKYGSFKVQIDSATSDHNAYNAAESTSPTLLYAASNLTYARHSLTLTNLGAVSANGDAGGGGFLLDFIHWTVQLAPAGATVKNVTYEEDNPAMTYTGEWGHNTSPAFSGGGTTYTNKDKATVAFTFRGSAIYVLGDKKNDHRIYGVKLDNSPEEFYNGISGCGGAFGLTCEQQVPILKYMGSNLDDSEHKITITNYAGVNNSFFDLDSIVVVEPSKFGPRELSTSTSPFVAASGSPSSSGPGSAASKTASVTGSARPTASGVTSSAANLGFGANPLLFLAFSILYLLHRRV